MQKIINILIVDDDLKLRSLLKKFLLEQHFDVTDVADTKAADRAMHNKNFDALVLDLMMPGENGLDYCKRLRASDNTIPIIMLSARGDDIDKIIGLEIGVDDYLSKPFNPRELVARIKAILRRPQLHNEAESESSSLTVGHFTFDLVTRTLSAENQKDIQLTSTEYDLLKALAQNANIPLSREKLVRMIHAKEFNIFDRSIDVLISRLRKLIEKDVNKPEVIKTVWGVGYILVSDKNV
ncbi:MAG: response regulator [Marinicellaceae bacterium]